MNPLHQQRPSTLQRFRGFFRHKDEEADITAMDEDEKSSAENIISMINENDLPLRGEMKVLPPARMSTTAPNTPLHLFDLPDNFEKAQGPGICVRAFNIDLLSLLFVLSCFLFY